MAEKKDDYPEYEVTFDGDLVVVEGSHIEEAIHVRGSHSFQLPEIGAYVDVKVVLTRIEDHEPDVPSLRITIKRASKSPAR